jgi:hypothetical protein
MKSNIITFTIDSKNACDFLGIETYLAAFFNAIRFQISSEILIFDISVYRFKIIIAINIYTV